MPNEKINAKHWWRWNPAEDKAYRIDAPIVENDQDWYTREDLEAFDKALPDFPSTSFDAKFLRKTKKTGS